MNMPQDTSTSPHDPSTPAIARLADTAGHDGPATPREVAGQLQSGGFFWLDLENPADDELAESEFVAGRQAQVINALTIVATVFLPFSFLTGYFGMNFRILTADVQTNSSCWACCCRSPAPLCPCCSSIGWSGASGSTTWRSHQVNLVRKSQRPQQQTRRSTPRGSWKSIIVIKVRSRTGTRHDVHGAKAGCRCGRSGSRPGSGPFATPPGCRGSARTGCGTAARRLIGVGASPKLVAQRTGYASPSIALELYSHVLPGYDRPPLMRSPAPKQGPM
jgi:hypothetical protein